MAPKPAPSLIDALQAELRKTALSPAEQAPILKAMLPFIHAREGLEKLLNLSRELMCIAGKDGHFRWVNDAFEQHLGYSREELLARPFFDFIHPDDVAITRSKLEKLLSGLDVIRFENRYRDKNGSWRHLSWVCPASPPESSELYAIAKDITAERVSM
jgi:PAS domain S-box-containing protein